MQTKQQEHILQISSNIMEKIQEQDMEKLQTISGILYFHDFEFTGSGLAQKDVFIVKIQNHEINDKSKTESPSLQNAIEEYNTYVIYDKDQNKIATVGKDGKIEFEKQYLQELRQISPQLFETLKLDNLDFELPQELQEQDRIISPEELQENQAKKQGNKSSKKQGKQVEAENEEQQKENVAQTLGIKKEAIRGLSQISPMQRISNTEALADVLPEAKQYTKLEVVCATQTNNPQQDAKFTILGIKPDGTREVLQSVQSIEGTSSNKDVISVNEDGSEVTQKSVQGLMQVNSKNREDGISFSLGDYGYLNIDYIRNVLDKDTRRAIPIETLDMANRRQTTHKVRENAGDNIEEIEKEGKEFQGKEKKGINPQTLEGVQVNQIEQLKLQIISQLEENIDMPAKQVQEFIRNAIKESNLQLKPNEIENIARDIHERVLDDSRFPTRNPRKIG